MPSLYEAAIKLQHPGQGPTNSYAFSEASGTTVADSGVANLPLTTNGAVTRGYQSLLPGDPEGRAAGQSKDTVLATRADNGIFDRPGTTNKLTLIVWYEPDDLRTDATGDVYTLVAKGTATYGLHIAGGRIRADIAGVTGPPTTGQLLSPIGDLIRVGVPTMFATVFDGAAGTWKLFVNGVIVGSHGLPAGQVIGHASGGTLQLGGYNAFSNNGIHGRIQHVTIFNSHALDDQVIRDLYRLGVVPPGSEGDQLMYVFPWHRQVVAAAGSHKTVAFKTTGPHTVSISRGEPAVHGGGVVLAPRGEVSKPSPWKGYWSAILDAPFGHARLEIEKHY